MDVVILVMLGSKTTTPVVWFPNPFKADGEPLVVY
jgi:hypothetical protein